MVHPRVAGVSRIYFCVIHGVDIAAILLLDNDADFGFSGCHYEQRIEVSALPQKEHDKLLSASEVYRKFQNIKSLPEISEELSYHHFRNPYACSLKTVQELVDIRDEILLSLKEMENALFYNRFDLEKVFLLWRYLVIHEGLADPHPTDQKLDHYLNAYNPFHFYRFTATSGKRCCIPIGKKKSHDPLFGRNNYAASLPNTLRSCYLAILALEYIACVPNTHHVSVVKAQKAQKASSAAPTLCSRDAINAPLAYC